MSTSRELPTDRLSTADSSGKRIYLYPSDVKGRYRRLRDYCHFILIFVFLLMPWIKISGQPALLLNIPDGQFAVLGITFWSHDAPLLVFIFGGGALTLGLMTAVWGRVWCGWACPQTVFIDSVFRRIERWIEGDSIARRNLDQSPWSARKIQIKGLKWLIFTFFSAIMSHSFLAYFVGAERLLAMMTASPTSHPVPFFVMAFVTAALLFDFGWFREQFCTLVCPYGRFQSVLMDDHSQVVAYDTRRGEPRKGTSDNPGDCVNCYRCVQVCPTGIDIRRGIQLECIACTACIDACDDVMRRLKKPEGLIRYTTLASGQKERLFRPRVAIYASLILALISGLSWTLYHRQEVQITVLRATGTPFQEISSQSGVQIVNHFKVDIKNQSFEDQDIQILLPEEEKNRKIELASPLQNPGNIFKGGEKRRMELFIRFPKDILQSGKLKTQLFMKWTNARTQESHTQTHEVKLVGPLQ